ncbi:MAG: aminotransferase class I/II-fold pyridoxal phosphate-dependent enzyme [Mesorhizobium sp.]
MNHMLAPRMSRVRPSATGAISDLARSLSDQGRSIINLGEGELDFDTPAHIKDVAVEALRRGETKYTAVAGTAAMKQAIIRKFHDENGLDYTPAEVIAGTGAKQLIFNALLATVAEGDEVIVPAPYWVSYPDMVGLAGGTAKIVSCEENNGWKLRAEALEAAITPSTKWLLLNSPGNPSGALYTRDDLAALAEVLLRHERVMVLADDIYEHISFTGDFHTLAQVEPRLKDRVLTVNGVSKSFSMTGWRIGFAGGPVWLIGAMQTLQSQSTSNPSSISQAAAVGALTGSKAFLVEWVEVLRQRRDIAAAILQSAPGLRCAVPDGAFYLFVNCAGLVGKKGAGGKAIETDIDLAAYLLDKAGVAVVPGSAFGVPLYFRVAFGVETEQLELACRRVADACAALR